MASKMKQAFEEHQEFIQDTFITACEGGINYWHNCISYDHKKGIYKGWDVEDNEFRDDVTFSTIREGIEALIALVDDDYVNSDIRFGVKGEQIPAESRIGILAKNLHTHYPNYQYDLLDIDAGDADIIVQFAMFGTVIYG